MKGTGKRVTIGFLSIVLLMLASGIVSMFELGNLSNDTEIILATSRRNLELAKDMLKSAHEHSQAMTEIALFDDSSKRDVCRRTLSDLEGKLATARSEAVYVEELDSLLVSVSTLREVSEVFMYPTEYMAPDTLIAAPAVATNLEVKRGQNREWFKATYRVAYDNMVGDIEDFMTHTHTSLEPRAEQLNKNAYRSVAPVLISLVVLIAIVLMLYYFIRVYLVSPIVKMNKALSDFHTYRLPFSVKAELRDELKELVENIEKLIRLLKLGGK